MIFLLFYQKRTQKIKILKTWKKLLEISSLFMCTKNHNNMIYVLRHRMRQTEFFIILGQFLLFTPSMIQKNKILKTMKKVPGNIIILHVCTINEDHMIYYSWDIRHSRHNFSSFWTIFCPFTVTLTIWKINLEKTPGGIIILHISTINDDYIWCMFPGDMKCEGQNFFVILDHFLHFYPANNPKNQKFEKMKKTPGDTIILHRCTINDNHIM